MSSSIPSSTLEKFSTFGDLLRYLRRRVGLTQLELAAAVGYSDTQISRLEQNLRLPDIPTIEARFVEALGLDDDPQAVARLLDLAAHVRREDAPAAGLSPYKGLHYFDESDADSFVGREALTGKLVERVLALASGDDPPGSRFLAVVGASGSGKSSLVRAGLVPGLRWEKKSAEWRVHLLTPTATPLKNLSLSLEGSAALAAQLRDELAREPRSLGLYAERETRLSRKPRLLIVVDQFEELFALCRSDEERAAFVDNLLLAASEPSFPVIVVITLRADFYAHCAQYPALREALAARQEYIGAMSNAELRRAIEEPARRGNWELEPGLADLLLHDVGREPGALPLLSHALLETWGRRRGRTMTLSGYASSGGVRGAIAETAESVFHDQFSNEQQAIARRIFLRLTELGDETATGDTRRRATFDELVLKPEESETTRAVLSVLADARLITISEDAAEVAHEALIREWPTLRGWLEDDREALRLHRQLTEAAQEWERAGRDADMLYRGGRLVQARDWAEARAGELNALEHDFLRASLAESEREAAEREAQRQRELEAAQKLAETESRSASRLRRRAYLLTGALGLVIIALFAAGLLANRAEAQRRLATSRELALAANNNLDVDGERSALLAIYALSQADTKEAEQALHQAVLGLHTRFKEVIDTDGIFSFTYSPDGSRMAIGGGDGTVRILDPETGSQLLTIGAGEGWVTSVVYSPDSKRLVTAGLDRVAYIWDATTGEKLLTLSGDSDEIDDLAFSPDGKYLVTASKDQTTRLWDPATGRQLRVFTGEAHPVLRAVFSPDGAKLAVGGVGDKMVSVWDLVADREALHFQIDCADALWGFEGLSYSSDGTQLIGTVCGLIRYWDAATGALISTSETRPPAYSPDGRVFTSGNSLVDAQTGQVLMTLAAANDGDGSGGSFSPDSRSMAQTTFDGTLRVWDITPHGNDEISSFAPGEFSSPVLSPDGKRIVVGSGSGTAEVRDSRTNEVLLTLSGHTGGVQAIFSPDGALIATASNDNTAKLWNASTGNQLFTLSGHGEGIVGDVFQGVMDVAFSPDGKMVATAGADGQVKVWDTATGKELFTLATGITDQGTPVGLTRVSFSPDGTLLAAAADDADASVVIWDIKTRKELRAAKTYGFARPWAMAFSQDGKKIASAGWGGDLKVVDVATGDILLDLKGNTVQVWVLAFSADGSRLASLAEDNSLRIWDMATGQEILNIAGYPTSHLAFDASGTRLLAISDQGVRIYSLDTQELIKIAKSRLTRSLTTEECQTYLHVEVCPPEP